MNIWKSKANLGRGGDNKIRNVEGKPSHVNPYEAYLIDAYKESGEAEVKRIGSGTTNPATGLKEYGIEGISNVAKGTGGVMSGMSSLLGPIGIGLQIGSMLFGGFSALENKKKVEQAKKGINANYQQQLDNLVKKKEMDFEKIDMQYKGQSQQANIQTGEAIEGVTQAATDVQIEQGFEVSEESTVDTTKLMNQYKTVSQNIFETRQMGLEESKFQEEIGKQQAADERDKMLAELEKVETSFLGGLFKG